MPASYLKSSISPAFARFGAVCFTIALSTVTAFQTVLAQGTGAPSGGPQPGGLQDILVRMAPMVLVVYSVVYFFIIKPQRSKDAERTALMSALKVGDNVVSSSGIIGRVTTIAENHITVEVAPGVKIKFELSAIVKREDKV